MFNIINIIKGNWKRFNGVSTPISRSRLAICKSCDNKKRILFVGYICKSCGCPIKSKVLVHEEKCPNNKWII